MPRPYGQNMRRGEAVAVTVLEARDLAVGALTDGAFTPVIRGLSFRLPAGRILGLVGESGAGKSMVGRAIAHLLPPGFAITGGTLTFAGQDLAGQDLASQDLAGQDLAGQDLVSQDLASQDLAGMAPRRRRALLGRAIAFIPQAPLTALNPVLTIGRQFDEHLARQGIPTRTGRRERAAAMLAAAQLADAAELLNRYPHQLSGGMCQRVLIAMAFASHPRLVVADEPTTALDATIQARIVELIAQMQQRHGTALIFITHDLRLAAQLCDEIMVMYAGRAIEHGPARTVLSAPAHPYTRCLQLANPAMSPHRRALYLLPEQMPSPRQLKEISGCHFAPRCPIASRECRLADPPSIAVASGHLAACIRPDVTAHIAAPFALPAAATAAGAASAVLQVESLRKRYFVARPIFGSSKEITAVGNVDFSIAENEFVGLVGESGSGKSTIARLLLGLERPT